MTNGTEFSEFDYACMAEAIALASKGRFTTPPNPNVGCVIVSPFVSSSDSLAEGTVIGRGYHAVAGGPHAEVHALKEAGAKAKGATAYVTLEPCSHYGRTPPCAKAIIEAGVSRVVVAMQDPYYEVSGRGLAILREAGIKVDVGLLAAEAAALNNGFIKRVTTGLPYVRVKLASSLDGRTALANGQSKWITGPVARHDVQLGRAMSSAILTGAGTVLADDPLLNVRLSEEEYPKNMSIRQPVRVVVDNRAEIHSQLNIWSDPAPVWVARPAQYHANEHGELPANGEVISVEAGADGRLDLTALLRELAQRGINDVWVEAGARLCGALIAAELADELIVYMAPKLLGSGAASLLELPALNSMQEVPTFTFSEVKQVGEDIKLVLKL